MARRCPSSIKSESLMYSSPSSFPSSPGDSKVQAGLGSSDIPQILGPGPDTPKELKKKTLKGAA